MAITNGYCTLAELKDYISIPVADTEDDSILEIAIESASRAIDSFTGLRFWTDATVVARYYSTTDEEAVDIPDGIQTTTGLVVKTDDDDDGVYETTWTLNTDFRLEPINAAADGLPWNRIVAVGDRLFPTTIYRGVEVTAKGGWSAVPVTVKQACLLQSSRFFKRKDAPFGVAGSVEFGSELRLLSALDPDVQLLLAAYRRPWVFV
jgi:hypothetical protein